MLSVERSKIPPRRETKSRFAGKYLLQILFFFLLVAQISFGQRVQTGRHEGEIAVSGTNLFSQSFLLQKPTHNHKIGSRGLVIELDSISPVLSQQVQTILGWNQVGTVTTDDVTQASIASDGSRLLVFYRQPNINLNLDEGHIREWNGSSWNLLATPTLQCHDPDIAVDGTLVGASFRTDGYDYGFVSNINGPWVTMTGNLLQNQWGMTVAIAQNRPYMTFACRYSDGQPFAYMMLHIISPLGPGPSATLNGGWRVIYTDVGIDPGITGDAGGWHAVFRQGPNLYVKKGYVNTSGQSFIQDVGSGFTVNGNPYNPEIVMYAGGPTVIWLENSGQKLYVAHWDGSQWILIGEASQTTGFIYSARAVTDGSDLYVSWVQSSGSPRIIVNSWNGSEWSSVPGVLESNSTSTISTAEIAIWNSSPTVVFVENSIVKVLTLATVPVIEQLDISGRTFSLSHNYPNPFNPSTSIQYALSSRQFVTLKVYDILGNEIETLANEEKPAGTYKVVFDATDLPSGVYFYKLQAGDFVETKKMMLMK